METAVDFLEVPVIITRLFRVLALESAACVVSWTVIL